MSYQYIADGVIKTITKPFDKGTLGNTIRTTNANDYAII